MSDAHTTNPSLRNKINFTKGWPNPNIVEAVLPPDSGVSIQAGFIGRRKATTPDKWILGVTELYQDAFVFRTDDQSPEAARGAHNTNYVQIPFGGVQGISLSNPLEFETTQFVGSPAKGDLLHSPATGDDAGKLVVCQLANGTKEVNDAVALVVCVAPVFYIGDTPYILVSPLQTRIKTSGA